MITRFARHLGPGSHLRGLVATHLLAGLLQGLALGMLIPFLRALLSGADPVGWLVAIGVTAGLSALIGALATVRGYEIASYDVCGRLIRMVGLKVQHLPLGWFDASSVGRVTTATSTDVHVLSHLPSMVLPQIASMTGAATGVAVMALAHEPIMGLAMVITLPLCAWCLRWLRRCVVQEFEAHEAAQARLSSRMLEFARLQAVLRSTGSCRDGWEPLETELDEEYRASARAMTAKGPAATVFHLGVEAAMILAVGAGLSQLLGGRLDAAAFAALALMAVRFAEPVGMLAMYVDPLHEADVALSSIGEILDAPILPEPEEDAGAPTAPYDVVLNQVSFGYTPGAPVLRDVSLRLPAGSVTALVGPSGSGKSTLLRLVARFWDVDAGEVSVGGVDVRRIPTAELMDAVSIVFQDVYLFDTTIEENVRIGRPGATDEEVRVAARRAGLEEVVDRLPAGWDTRVGEAGGALSGGERQRVALARAFLKDAPILLLDEVTSALDGANEAAVTRAMEELSRGRTVLVIAHRLTTIRGADRIVVLTDGRVEAVGSHEELYATAGTYRRFWEDQTAVDRWRLVRAGR